MKKVVFLVAALIVSTAALAQPAHGPASHGPGVDSRHDQPVDRHMQSDHKKKVWVPAHREHGRLVKDHYTWRRIRIDV
jgi:Ni/Co efflux regulator RcnB